MPGAEAPGEPARFPRTARSTGRINWLAQAASERNLAHPGGAKDVDRRVKNGAFARCGALRCYGHGASVECGATDDLIIIMSIAKAIEHIPPAAAPLHYAEIVVNLKERGYREDADPRMLLQTLREAIKRNREKFVKVNGGKWALA
jgi:hypothetical protein